MRSPKQSLGCLIQLLPEQHLLPKLLPRAESNRPLRTQDVQNRNTLLLQETTSLKAFLFPADNKKSWEQDGKLRIT